MRTAFKSLIFIALLTAGGALATPKPGTDTDVKQQMLISLDNLEVIAANSGLPLAILDAIQRNRQDVLAMHPSEFQAMPAELRSQLFEVARTTTSLKAAFAQQQPLVLKSSGFPDANYPVVNWTFTIEAIGDLIEGDSQDQTRGDVCGFPGYTANTRFTVLNAAIVAEAVKDIAEQFCGQSGLGFNASVICVFTDILAYVAIGIDANQELCNDFMTAAEVSGSYNRLDHIHTDLADAETAVLDAIATHDTEIKALLATLQAGIDANAAKLELLLARQLETIRLLHTPQGRRTTDVPACEGAPCGWNP